jgi:transcription initiation factor IIE alpha subunit
MYTITLYCSDPACDAIFEAEGSLDALAAAICPFCGCMLAEMTCSPCGEEDETESQELELWTVLEPSGRRLRQRRRSKKRLQKAA